MDAQVFIGQYPIIKKLRQPLPKRYRGIGERVREERKKVHCRRAPWEAIYIQMTPLKERNEKV